MPDGLRLFKAGSAFPVGDLTVARLVFYPESRDKGDALCTFARTRLAHYFISSNHFNNVKVLRKQLEGNNPKVHPQGYELISFSEINRDEARLEWGIELANEQPNNTDKESPAGFWAVLERSSQFKSDHGVERFCLLHFVAESTDVLKALFYCKLQKPPYAIYSDHVKLAEQLVQVTDSCALNRPRWVAYPKHKHGREEHETHVAWGKSFDQPAAKVLEDCRENMPRWLASHGTRSRFPLKSMLRSRNVFYPCSGTDRHPVQIFGRSHAAHSFIFVDWNEQEETVTAKYTQPGFLDGYHCTTCKEIPVDTIFPADWGPAFKPPDHDTNQFMPSPSERFVIWFVFERDSNRDEEHGPARISLLHIRSDFHAAFERLFCQPESRMAYAAILTRYDGNSGELEFGGSLEASCHGHNYSMPHWLLVDDIVRPWAGYVMSSRLEKMDSNPRALFRDIHIHRRLKSRISIS